MMAYVMKEKRYISSFIQEDLASKMVFIGGPRQVGKTSTVQNLAQHFTYFVEIRRGLLIKHTILIDLLPSFITLTGFAFVFS